METLVLGETRQSRPIILPNQVNNLGISLQKNVNFKYVYVQNTKPQDIFIPLFLAFQKCNMNPIIGPEVVKTILRKQDKDPNMALLVFASIHISKFFVNANVRKYRIEFIEDEGVSITVVLSDIVLTISIDFKNNFSLLIDKNGIFSGYEFDNPKSLYDVIKKNVREFAL